MGAPPTPLAAVVFDVDGVLVDSMRHHHEAYVAAFAPLGVQVEQHDVFDNEGRRSREVIEAISRARGLSLSPEEIAKMSQKKQEVFASFGALPLYPGARELLASLHARGLKRAAVTGTNRANVDRHLGPLAGELDVVVTADDVTHTKPHPEPYLTALEKLDLPAGRAVVVENAVLGIQSAKAAGLRVIAVMTTQPRERLAQADVVVRSLLDVEGALGRLSA